MNKNAEYILCSFLFFTFLFSAMLGIFNFYDKYQLQKRIDEHEHLGEKYTEASRFPDFWGYVNLVFTGIDFIACLYFISRVKEIQS